EVARRWLNCIYSSTVGLGVCRAARTVSTASVGALEAVIAADESGAAHVELRCRQEGAGRFDGIPEDGRALDGLSQQLDGVERQPRRVRQHEVVLADDTARVVETDADRCGLGRLLELVEVRDENVTGAVAYHRGTPQPAAALVARSGVEHRTRADVAAE